ncbi:MAG: VTT domain-containing protein [Gemmatimonadetes bacterium]|nr:VTT domain-containing protein [Gemmatimonadota bacterium]MBI2403328.1 VTT domain-containing protein [Gemmatimonadota bacterium]
MLLALLAYAFVSNVALALVPHEPVVVFYGSQLGAWTTAVVATAGTVLASWVDHRVFVPLITRASQGRDLPSLARAMMRLFNRAPFAVIAVSGLTPLPFFPFKALAFAARYPLGSYLAAVAAGRLPRYLLLAWLGAAFKVPLWALGALFVLLAIPSLRVALARGRTAPAS